MLDLLNRQAKALVAATFTAAAVVIETNAPNIVGEEDGRFGRPKISVRRTLLPTAGH